jgi:arsenate reductase
VKALGEIAIDISRQFSKKVKDISPGDLDAVITLCAEEVCPVFLGKARRVPRGLPDPASAPGERARLEAFRAVRDELLRRLGKMFAR